MKTWIPALLGFLLPLAAIGALSEADKAILPFQNRMLTNPGFELAKAGWTASGGTFTVTSAAKASGGFGGEWDASASNQTLKSTLTAVPDGLKGRNGVASCVFKATTGTATHTIAVDDGTNILGSGTATTIMSSTSSFMRTSFNFIYPTSGSVELTIRSAANEPDTYIDNCYFDLADGFNISQVSQAGFYGGISWVPTVNCAWSTTSTSWANFAVDTDCTIPTGTLIEGSASAPATKVPGITFATLPAGDYYIVAKGSFWKTNVDSYAYYRFSDGTNATNEQQVYTNGTVYSIASTLVGRLKYTTAQSNITIQIQGKSGNGTVAAQLNNSVADGVPLEFMVYRFPLTSEQAFRAEQVISPTVQKFTSGSGTYTKPNNATYITVKMVGGGGGGGGAGTAGGSGGGNGGDTTFGLHTATGGGGGPKGNNGPDGGTGTLGAGAVGTATSGGGGGAGAVATGTGFVAAGGIGGASAFGGGGASGYTGVGHAGPAWGSGGGGAGNTNAAAMTAGSGGGAGGFVMATIASPSSTYSYSVGAAGTAGTAGTNGFAGGAGSSGYIEVTEYYGNNAPILVGGSAYYSGYHDSTCSWARTNTALGAPAVDLSCALNQIQSSGVGTVTTEATGLPGITLTNPSVLGKYRLTVKFTQHCATAATQVAAKLQQDGVGIDDSSFRCAQSNDSGRVVMESTVSITGTTTFDIWTSAASGATTIDQENANAVRIIKWDLSYVGP